jgi:hypothetical protein
MPRSQSIQDRPHRGMKQLKPTARRRAGRLAAQGSQDGSRSIVVADDHGRQLRRWAANRSKQTPSLASYLKCVFWKKSLYWDEVSAIGRRHRGSETAISPHRCVVEVARRGKLWLSRHRTKIGGPLRVRFVKSLSPERLRKWRNYDAFTAPSPGKAFQDFEPSLERP